MTVFMLVSLSSFQKLETLYSKINYIASRMTCFKCKFKFPLSILTCYGTLETIHVLTRFNCLYFLVGSYDLYHIGLTKMFVFPAEPLIGIPAAMLCLLLSSLHSHFQLFSALNYCIPQPILLSFNNPTADFLSYALKFPTKYVLILSFLDGLIAILN